MKKAPNLLRWYLANITAWGAGIGLCALLISFTAVNLEPYTGYRSTPYLPPGAYILIVLGVIVLGGAVQGWVAYTLRQQLYGLRWERGRAIGSAIAGVLLLPVVALLSAVAFWRVALMTGITGTDPDNTMLWVANGGIALFIVAPVFGSLAALVRIKIVTKP